MARFTNVSRADREFAGLTTNVSVFGAVLGPCAVGTEQSCRFVHPVGPGAHDAEAAAVVDIQVREIEGQHVQDTPVDQDVLVVIADQVV